MTNKFIFAALASSLLCAGANAQTKNFAKSVAVTGLVAGTPTGQQFNMRANGQTYRVTALDKVSLRNVRGGDRVRVWGIPTRQTLQRANVRVVQSSASDNPDDYAPAGTAGGGAPSPAIKPGPATTGKMGTSAGIGVGRGRGIGKGTGIGTTMGNGVAGAMGNGTMGAGTTTR